MSQDERKRPGQIVEALRPTGSDAIEAHDELVQTRIVSGRKRDEVAEIPPIGSLGVGREPTLDAHIPQELLDRAGTLGTHGDAGVRSPELGRTVSAHRWNSSSALTEYAALRFLFPPRTLSSRGSRRPKFAFMGWK